MALLLLRESVIFDLFLLVLHALQDGKIGKEKMSYSQVAGVFSYVLWNDKFEHINCTGIHGLPKAYWDQVLVDTKRPKNRD